MQFVTRVNVHVDRISSAWAIRRFVDPAATFLFVERTRDLSLIDAIPFDMRGVELGHHHGRCSFEAVLDKYGLRDPALRRMGEVIRAIDMPMDGEPPAEYTWVSAAFDELRDAGLGDDERLVQGAAICERLYRACGAPRRI